MSERFYTVDLPIPAELADIFLGIKLCSNGSVVVAYKVPTRFDGVNVGDMAAPIQWVVAPGAMVALDMLVQR